MKGLVIIISWGCSAGVFATMYKEKIIVRFYENLT